jgi:hypothetical protein
MMGEVLRSSKPLSETRRSRRRASSTSPVAEAGFDSAVEQVRENSQVVFDAAQGWGENGSTIQLSPVLHLFQEPNIVFGQTVRLGALLQQREIMERWGVVVFIAFSH